MSERPDYLWDRSGSPDPDVARLEQVLAPLRHRAPLRLPGPARRPRRAVAIGAGVAALAAAVILWAVVREPRRAACASAPIRAGMRFEAVAGAPRCGGVAIERGWLPAGAAIETAEGDRVRVDVADIGRVMLAGDSHLALVGTSAREHRLSLRRGSLHARVNAPPRLFVIETPAATAVDLGCEYDLSVGDDGSGVLRVVSGQVELEAPGRRVVVPMGTQARIRAGRGPGTPVATARVAALGALVDRHDAGDAAALADLLVQSGPLDTATLWNLLAVDGADDRGRVYDRLAELAPPPVGVFRTAVVAGDEQALLDWRHALEDAWLYGTAEMKLPPSPP